MEIIIKERIKKSEVFDSYWKFATKRQEIFYNRFNENPHPWIDDEILNTYKFTNVYRASDRVSQYLIREVIYKNEQTLEEMFFRILLFKIFNKIETWELLKNKVGEISFKDYSFQTYNKVLHNSLNNKKPIYSAAYIMSSGKEYFGYTRKHENHLKLLEMLMHDEVPDKISNAKSMQEVFLMLRSYPTFGDFLAYQITIDLNYSPLTNFSENDFVMPGPGAKDGIQKCFIDTGGLNEIDMIQYMVDHQEDEFDRLNLNFQSLWGRKLKLIDCQNLFCEVDKYARVKHPMIIGKSGRTRIKQVFRETPNKIDYWYPPKWGINERIKKQHD